MPGIRSYFLTLWIKPTRAVLKSWNVIQMSFHCNIGWLRMVFSQCAMIIPHAPLAEEDGRHLSQRGAGARRVATIEFWGWGPSKIDFRIGKRMEKNWKGWTFKVLGTLFRWTLLLMGFWSHRNWFLVKLNGFTWVSWLANIWVMDRLLAIPQ